MVTWLSIYGIIAEVMLHPRVRLHHRRLAATLVFSSILLGLIALAIGESNPGIALAALLSVAALATVFHFILPGGDFFSAVFANSIGIYACLYVFFVSENFSRADALSQKIGFALPLIGFLIGVIWRRRQITAAVGKASQDIEKDLWRAAIWIPPLIAVAAGSFLAPLDDLGREEHSIALLGAMTIIALTALLAARDIAAFLLDIGVLFETFFTNAAQLAKPAFAFFTCYSLLALIFGCLYAILDRYSELPNFSVNGELRPITFAEGLYLSVVTLSTVGYGDLSATSPIARIIVAGEIFAGVLLLLFGLQAILSSTRR